MALEQEIRFCTTSDGVNVAYGLSGEGMPVVFVLGWGTHLEYSRAMPGFEQSVWGLLERECQFIMYDGRGFGLSDRGIREFGVEDKIRDLEAVVDAIGLEKFSMVGISEGGPTAMTFAQRYPERVSKLVLIGTFARREPPKTDAELAEMRIRFMALRAGWGNDTPEFRQLWTMQFMPEGSPETLAWFNELQRRSADGETVAALVRAIGQIDVRETARGITTPTLVIHARGDRAVPFELGREVASLIPGARFAPVESNNHLPLPRDPATARMAQLIDEVSRWRIAVPIRGASVDGSFAWRTRDDPLHGHGGLDGDDAAVGR